MDAEGPKNSVYVVHSNLSGDLLRPSDLKVILERSFANTCNGKGTTTVFGLMPTDTPTDSDFISRKIYSLTVAPVQQISRYTLEDILKRSEAFIWNKNGDSRSSMTAMVGNSPGRKDNVTESQGDCLIVLNELEGATTENVVSTSKEERTEQTTLNMNAMAGINVPNTSMFWHKWKHQWQKSHRYESLLGAEIASPSGLQSRRRFVVASTLLFFVVLIFPLLTVAILRGNGDGTYIRYDTSGSDGPRHQLRIYWQNASEWAAANPQDTGKWRVRLDDQSIIPAELYDEDEDRYQSWYRNRYPEAQQVVDNLNYVRPAWLGSLDMMTVPWDSQFHFAHCVLALRRYWKAKESGKHVCGRDIDYEHINHCLESLEERAFIEGPRVEMDPPEYLYWQTRVCF
jgi:hypothetical protein